MSPQASHEEFLRRRTEIGASEAGAICGVDQYKTAADVYDRLVALRDHDTILESEKTAAMERGIRLEPIIAEIYADSQGRRVRVQNVPDRCPEFEHLQANPDRLILAEGSEGTGLLEAKCPGLHRYKQIKDHGIPDSWNVQGQAQLACRPNIGYVDYAIHNAEEWETIVVRIERHDDFIGDVLLPACQEFWLNHFEPRVRPDEEREPVELPPAWDGEIVDLSARDDLAQAVAEYHEANRMKKEIKDLLSSRRERLEAALQEAGDPQVAAVEDFKVSHKWVTPKKGRLDSKRLDAFLLQNCNLRLDDFYGDPNPYRRLLVTERS